MALSRIVSELNSDICKISPPLLYLTPHLMGFSLEFCNGGGVEKRQWRPYKNVKKCDDMSIRLDTALALDRQTDRQTDRELVQYRALHALHADAWQKM